MGPQYFTPEEVAAHFRVKAITVRRWIRQGKMSALDLATGNRPGPYLISPEDIEEFEDRQYRAAKMDELA